MFPQHVLRRIVDEGHAIGLQTRGIVGETRDYIAVGEVVGYRVAVGGKAVGGTVKYPGIIDEIAQIPLRVADNLAREVYEYLTVTKAVLEFTKGRSV